MCPGPEGCPQQVRQCVGSIATTQQVNAYIVQSAHFGSLAAITTATLAASEKPGVPKDFSKPMTLNNPLTIQNRIRWNGDAAALLYMLWEILREKNGSADIVAVGCKPSLKLMATWASGIRVSSSFKRPKSLWNILKGAKSSHSPSVEKWSLLAADNKRVDAFVSH